MQTEYKGYEILYDEGNNRFYLEEDHNTHRPSLSELKKHIDRITKKSFKRINVLYKTYDYSYGDTELVKAQITSIDDERAWVSYKGSRAKVSFDELFEDSEDTLKKFAEIVKKRKEGERLSKEKSKLWNSMKNFKVKGGE